MAKAVEIGLLIIDRINGSFNPKIGVNTTQKTASNT